MGAEHLLKLPGLRNACASKHQATNDLRLVDSYICMYHFEHAHKILSANFKFVFRIWKPHLQKALFALSDGAAATVLRRICCCLPNPGDDFTTACFVPNSVAVGISSSDSSFKHEPSQRRKDICFQIFSVGLDGWDGFDVVLWKPFSVFLSRELIYQVLWNLKPAMLCHPSKDWIKMD